MAEDWKVTLEVDGLAVAAGDKVGLTVRLPTSPEDVSGIRIEFEATGGTITKQGTPHQQQTMLAKERKQLAVWAFEADTNTGIYSATVKLKRGNELLDTDTKNVSVLKQPLIEIEPQEPEPVPEGGLLQLKANPSGHVDVLELLGIRVRWDAGNKGVMTMDAAPSLNATWNTTGLTEGSYTIKAQLADAKGNVLYQGRDHTAIEAEVEGKVRPRS